jgi:TonB family protein
MGSGLSGMPRASETAPDAASVAAAEAAIATYVQSINQQIDQHWQHVTVTSFRRPVVAFIIDRNGEILNLELLDSSGLDAADQAAINSVQSAAPFDPLPAEYEAETLRIRFTFTYEVN